MLDLRLGVINLNNIKNIKKTDKELMLIVGHPTKVWNCCMTKD